MTDGWADIDPAGVHDAEIVVFTSFEPRVKGRGTLAGVAYNADTNTLSIACGAQRFPLTPAMIDQIEHMIGLVRGKAAT